MPHGLQGLARDRQGRKFAWPAIPGAPAPRQTHPSPHQLGPRMDPNEIVKLLVALVAVAGSYFVSQRVQSRSAARLRDDLALLEKAVQLKLPSDQITALEYRVRAQVDRHTRSARPDGRALGPVKSELPPLQATEQPGAQELAR
jgi:hypothetical protein